MKKVILFFFVCNLITVVGCRSVENTKTSSDNNIFVAEKIVWSQALSKKLSSIVINVLFPAGYRILDEAHPYVKLLTPDGKLIKDYMIDKFPFDIQLAKKINSSQFFVDLSIYYCRDTAVGMCLRKNVLYEINLDDHAAQDNLKIDYQIKDEGY